MSDLISKSETIDLLYQVFEKHSMATDKNDFLGGFGAELFKNIKAMPTSYSVDKVVEELEIERKTANNTYNSFNMDVDLGRVFGLEKAIEIVKQEAEQCNNGWIACSERLPEESGYYLVTYHDWSDGNFLPKYDDTYVRRLHYQISEHFVGWNYPKNVDDRAENDCHKEVIAWQPLPEPFKERD